MGHPWSSISASLSASDIGGRQQGLQIPTYNIGGWYDIFLGDTIANYQAMRSQGAPAKLLIGPWSHSELGGRVGERNFGYAAQSGFINLQTDLLGLQVRWFDHWLKGIDTGLLAEPPVKIFVMGINAWRDEAEWPLARARNVPYYLHEGGRLSPETPWDEAPDVYMYDPEDPVPTRGGATLMTPEYPAGPYDQRAIESRPDVLVYTSEVLGEDLEVTGPIAVHLWAISSAPDTDFVARLTDVFPDDSSICLTDGIVRARYRNFAPGRGAVAAGAGASIPLRHRPVGDQQRVYGRASDPAADHVEQFSAVGPEPEYGTPDRGGCGAGGGVADDIA